MSQPIQALNILGGPAPVAQPAAVAATPQDDTIHEVLIVGSGPAGYTAAIYTARAEMKPIVIAGALDAGGALMTTTDVENFPGFPDGIQGPELMTNLQEQAERFGAEVVYDDAVNIELEGEIKRVTLDDGTVYQAKSLIITTGSAYRKLGIDGEETLSGKGVSWCATCDGFFFKDQEIVVVGGGDSAVEEATFLTRFGKTVTLVHRRDELRASKIMARRAAADPKLSFAWNSEVVSINGRDKVESVTLRDTVTGQERVLLTNAVFEAIGHIPRTDLLRGKLELDDEGYIVCVGRSTNTSVPGVFAAGDVVDHTYRQAITAAGTGCQAALDAERWLADTAAGIDVDEAVAHTVAQ
ncbi:MAG: thioredoxin-disulfide reductase [Brachybacterium sp.]|uniref:thioredoxin-disulfide reductase n=1 Tax=Brachybacterium sp. TaxID=1891286 RepID=UPI00264DE724|nr:thioredoxin-disulfide reductase [Brachybacterium sp.]MDN6328812.1 thioredoxin-disulfide reductase [Brachybacterium sp.]MDN6398921.1 thioredoxin-disulfide reductase [Brachybacterium sp.]